MMLLTIIALKLMLMLNDVADNDSVEVGRDVSANDDVDIECC